MFKELERIGKIGSPTQFAYVPVTSRNGDKITIAKNSLRRYNNGRGLL